jgi:hypothetical protein
MGESDGQSSLQEKPPTVADIFKKWPGFSVFALFSGIFAIIGAFLSPRYYTVVMLSGYAALFGQFYLARNNGKVGKILAKTGIACGIIAIIMLVIQVAMEFL